MPTVFGTLGKLIAAIVLIVACLAMLIAPGLVAYGLQDQSGNEADSGPLGIGEDNERTEQNGAVILAGAGLAVAGVVVAVIGLVVAGLSAAGSNAYLQRKTRQQQQVLVEDA